MRLAMFVIGIEVCASTLVGCTKVNAPPVTHSPTLADSAQQVMLDVNTLLTSRGVQRGVLTADTTFIFNDQTRFVFSNPRVNFNTTLGQPNGTMTADRGVYDLRTQILEGFGHVVITTTDGKRLTSPHLTYNQVANLVSSDTTFEMTDKDRVQRGIGFDSDPNLTRFACHKACGGSGTVVLPTQ